MKKIITLGFFALSIAPLAAEAKAKPHYYCEAVPNGRVLYGPDGAVGMFGTGASMLCAYYAAVGNLFD
jgi:hypothetical protein